MELEEAEKKFKTIKVDGGGGSSYLLPLAVQIIAPAQRPHLHATCLYLTRQQLRDLGYEDASGHAIGAHVRSNTELVRQNQNFLKEIWTGKKYHSLS